MVFDLKVITARWFQEKVIPCWLAVLISLSRCAQCSPLFLS
jgi:hypothetical protein